MNSTSWCNVDSIDVDVRDINLASLLSTSNEYELCFIIIQCHYILYHISPLVKSSLYQMYENEMLKCAYLFFIIYNSKNDIYLFICQPYTIMTYNLLFVLFAHHEYTQTHTNTHTHTHT